MAGCRCARRPIRRTGASGRQGNTKRRGKRLDSHQGIAGDDDTAIRDATLKAWGNRPAVVFGDLMLAPPAWDCDRCSRGARRMRASGARPQGFRRDAEAVYLIGPWPSGLGGRRQRAGDGRADARRPGPG